MAVTREDAGVVSPIRHFRAELPRLSAVLGGYAVIRVLGLLILQAAAGRDAYGELSAWDGEWFLRIATQGYPDELDLGSVDDDRTGGLAFFPAYPMLMRWLGLLGLEPVTAGLTITVIAGLVAAAGVYVVAREVLPPHGAALAVVLWSALPMSIVLSMVYSEALFVAFASWAIYAAMSRHWMIAGVLAFAAGMTRSVGLAVGLAVVAAAVVAWRREQSRGWRPVIGSVLALSGVPTWWVIVAVISGRLDGWFAVQEFFWGSRFDFGVSFANIAWQMLTFAGRYDALRRVVYTTSVIVLLFALVLVIDLAVRAVRDSAWLPLAVYAVSAVGLTVGNAGFVHSKIRLLVPVFVLVFVIARAMQRWALWARACVIVVFAIAGAWWGVLMLTVWSYAI